MQVLKKFVGIISSRNIFKNHSSISQFTLNQLREMATKQQIVLGPPSKIRDNPALMKIDTPEFKSIFTDELQQLVDIFQKYNHEIRIAGGAVRDLILHNKPKDIDFATTATPDEMKEMFTNENIRMINTNGERHGTITPRIADKENYEVTTLRIDVRTDGRRAEVLFTTDWQLDANRRDLTINSMFLGFDGTLYDYFYGYEDLLNRRVLFVGDADIRIKEDYLRILRYFRFYGRIANESNKHDPQTLEAIKKNAEGLSGISGERIWMELQKIVLGNFNCELVLEMYKCDLLQYCGLPKEPNIKEFKRVCKTLEQFKPNNLPILYLIGLLNNYEDAIQLHGRLKLSAFERDLIFFIIQQKDKVGSDYSSLRDYQILSFQVRRDFVEEFLKYCDQLEFYEQFKAWKTPKFPINGNILQQNRNLPKKQFGAILYELKIVWANSNFTLTSEDLLDIHLPQILLKCTSPNPKKKLKLGDS